MPKTNNCKRSSGWCPPATIYAVIVVVLTILNLVGMYRYDDLYNNGENKYLYFFVHLFVSGLWLWLLYYLCANCHETAAWTILLFPILLGTALFTLAIVPGVFTSVTQRGPHAEVREEKVRKV